MQYEERKSRIFMRGVKIGSKRTTSTDKGMKMFEMSSDKKTPEEIQAFNEANVKEKFVDDGLDL